MTSLMADSHLLVAQNLTADQPEGKVTLEGNKEDSMQDDANEE